MIDLNDPEIKKAWNVLMKFILFVMFIALISLGCVVLSGCQALPGLFQAAEDIADDTAVKVEVSKEALQKESDLQVTVDITNKDQPKAKS